MKDFYLWIYNTLYLIACYIIVLPLFFILNGIIFSSFKKFLLLIDCYAYMWNIYRGKEQGELNNLFKDIL